MSKFDSREINISHAARKSGRPVVRAASVIDDDDGPIIDQQGRPFSPVENVENGPVRDDPGEGARAALMWLQWALADEAEASAMVDCRRSPEGFELEVSEARERGATLVVIRLRHYPSRSR